MRIIVNIGDAAPPSLSFRDGSDSRDHRDKQLVFPAVAAIAVKNTRNFLL